MLNKRKSRLLRSCSLCLSAVALGQLTITPVLAAQPGQAITPIKHVIVIIGENRSFDHVFATYRPTDIKGRPQEVLNLLSEGIVSMKGTTAVPGPNWKRAVQKQVASQESVFLLSPPSTDYKVLPNPLAGGPSGQFANLTGFCATAAACTTLAEEVETGLPTSYYASLASGGTGLTSGTPWLSPNHSLSCGDVIVAAASASYDGANFTGKP